MPNLYEQIGHKIRELRGSLSQEALATELGVEISTMSRNVSVLERNGYLARARNTDDGRIVQTESQRQARYAASLN